MGTWWRAVALLVSLALCACEVSGEPGGDCPDLAGTWVVDSHCESSLVGDTFTVTQRGCDLTVSAPFNGWTGYLSSAGGLTMSGPAGDTYLTCTGSATATAVQTRCSPGSCSVRMSRQGGPVSDAPCDRMCAHLVDELGGCGKGAGASRVACEDECEEHVQAGEASAADAECGAAAADCAAWRACGDLL
jgi:hypothetical protein